WAGSARGKLSWYRRPAGTAGSLQRASDAGKGVTRRDRIVVAGGAFGGDARPLRGRLHPGPPGGGAPPGPAPPRAGALPPRSCAPSSRSAVGSNVPATVATTT